MRMLRPTTLAVALLMVASTAFAGARPATRIKVKNASAAPIIAAVDPAGTTTAELIEADGKVINPGSSKSFSVSAGDHDVVIVDANNQFEPVTETVTARKGKTTKVTFEGFDEAEAQ